MIACFGSVCRYGWTRRSRRNACLLSRPRRTRCGEPVPAGDLSIALDVTGFPPRDVPASLFILRLARCLSGGDRQDRATPVPESRGHGAMTAPPVSGARGTGKRRLACRHRRTDDPRLRRIDSGDYLDDAVVVEHGRRRSVMDIIRRLVSNITGDCRMQLANRLDLCCRPGCWSGTTALLPHP